MHITIINDNGETVFDTDSGCLIGAYLCEEGARAVAIAEDVSLREIAFVVNGARGAIDAIEQKNPRLKIVELLVAGEQERVVEKEEYTQIRKGGEMS